MAKAIHMMIRVLDEKRSVEFYERAFALAIAERLVFDGFTLVYMRNMQADFEVELTINHGRSEPYHHGDAYGHIAFVVEDLASEHARFATAGLNPTPVKEFMREEKLFAKFFFVQDPDGYKIEILQRHGRYR